jgi:hypothetical protein
MTDAYPLAWPEGWPRMSRGGRKSAKFATVTQKYGDGGSNWKASSKLSIGEGTKRILAELRTFGVRDGQFIISTNLKLRQDGLPYSDQRAPEDPGVAVYWTRKGKQQVMAIDLYDRVADNLAAIAATLNAMRAIERHGGATILDRAFTGFTALANPDTFDAHSVMGLLRQHGPFTRDQISARFKDLSRIYHPDSGHERASTEEFQKLVRARDELLKGCAT